MVFESACVSSHIQEKEKDAAAVSTKSVLQLMFIIGSRLLSDTLKVKTCLLVWSRTVIEMTICQNRKQCLPSSLSLKCISV